MFLTIYFSDNDIQLPWLVDGDEFHAMLSRGEFQSYEHRLSLGSELNTANKVFLTIDLRRDCIFDIETTYHDHQI